MVRLLRSRCSCRFQPNQVTLSQLWRCQDRCKRYANETSPFIARQQMCRLPHASHRILTLHPLSNPFSWIIEMKSRGDTLQCQCNRQRRLPRRSTAPNDTTRSASTEEQRHLAWESDTSDTPPPFPSVLDPSVEPQSTRARRKSLTTPRTQPDRLQLRLERRPGNNCAGTHRQRGCSVVETESPRWPNGAPPHSVKHRHRTG